MTEKEIIEYKITFDFTTVHKGSRFVGRSVECWVTASNELNDGDKLDDALLMMCAHSVHELKPKWNIFTLTITNIIFQAVKQEINSIK